MSKAGPGLSGILKAGGEVRIRWSGREFIASANTADGGYYEGGRNTIAGALNDLIRIVRTSTREQWRR